MTKRERSQGLRTNDVVKPNGLRELACIRSPSHDAGEPRGPGGWRQNGNVLGRAGHLLMQ